MTTITEAETAYLDNADYRETNSITKAKRFVTACRRLIVLLPSTTQKGPNMVSLNTSLIKDQLDEAQSWLVANEPTQLPGPRTSKADFGNFRSRSGAFGGRYN